MLRLLGRDRTNRLKRTVLSALAASRNTEHIPDLAQATWVRLPWYWLDGRVCCSKWAEVWRCPLQYAC